MENLQQRLENLIGRLVVENHSLSVKLEMANTHIEALVASEKAKADAPPAPPVLKLVPKYGEEVTEEENNDPATGG